MKLRIRMITIWGLAMLAAWAGLTAAQDRLTTPVDCAAPATQRAMHVCAERAAAESVEKLTQLLQELRPSLSAQEAAALDTIQQAWSNVREQNCAWQRDLFQGGSTGPLIYWNCVQSQTASRIDQLKILLCEGRGMTGPCEASEKY